MKTLSALMDRFPDEDACRSFLAALRWPDKVRCPRCGFDKVYKVSRPWSWVCKSCDKNGYRFSVTAGTIFENTKFPLRQWFGVAFLMCQAKKGISALQVQRMIGCGSYETAHYLCHRIRAAMKNEEFMKLTGVVEVDETYVGGKAKNMHYAKRKKLTGTGGADKTTVIGAISRKGNVVAKVIEKTDAATLTAFVNEAISEKVDLVATDEHKGYMWIGGTRKHAVIRHGAGEYVRGSVHTNNIEGFWSLLKRGIVGTFHNVSKQYLPLYLNEFAFRHNFRDTADLFTKLISSC